MKLTMLRARGIGQGLGLRATGTNDAVATVAEPERQPGGGTILAWPVERLAAGSGVAGVAVSAEVRTRRFADGRVEEERWEASAVASDRTPTAILAALADGLAAAGLGAAGGERVVVEVRIVA